MITCPYCDNKHEDWWEYINFDEEDQDFEMFCGHCLEEFKVGMKVTRAFTSYEID